MFGFVDAAFVVVVFVVISSCFGTVAQAKQSSNSKNRAFRITGFYVIQLTIILILLYLFDISEK